MGMHTHTQFTSTRTCVCAHEHDITCCVLRNVHIPFPEQHGGFKPISAAVKARRSSAAPAERNARLLWGAGLLSFFMSAVFDNLTTTIVMLSIMQVCARMQLHDDHVVPPPVFNLLHECSSLRCSACMLQCGADVTWLGTSKHQVLRRGCAIPSKATPIPTPSPSTHCTPCCFTSCHMTPGNHPARKSYPMRRS